MTARKIYTFRLNDATPDDHIGRVGEITYRDGYLYYHDGATAGGELINGGGSGGVGTSSWSSVTGKPSFAAVATSGSYADLTGKPTIVETNQTLNTSDSVSFNRLTVTGTGASGIEGGEIQLAKAPTSTLAGDVIIDVYENKLRFFEGGGNGRGFYLDLTTGANNTNTNIMSGGGSASWPVTNTAGASGPTLIAIGKNAGLTSQGVYAVAVGRGAGQTSQGANSVAIGQNAGETGQQLQSVAIGLEAGQTNQGHGNVAIGQFAGQTSQGQFAVAIGSGSGGSGQGIGAVSIGINAGGITQGDSAVAIGNSAGETSQAANSIILNATGAALNQTTASTFTVAPIRNASGTSGVLQYNTATKEVSYSNEITVNSNVWTFGTDGNLTLPAGGDILVDDGKIISADGEDFKIIVQDSDDNGNRLDLVVTDGTNQATRVEVDIDGMQIHTNLLDVENQRNWTFKSDGTTEFPNYTISQYSSLKIKSGNPSSSTAIWTFGDDGALTLPAGGTIAEGGGFTGAIKLTPAGGANEYQALLIYPTAAGDGDHIHLTAGGGTTELYLGNDLQYVKIENGGNIRIQADNGVNGAAWTFGTDGSLTMPADSSILTNETALKIATHPTTTYTFNQAYWEALNGNATRMLTTTGNAQYFSCTVTANQDGTYTVADLTGNSFEPGDWFKVPGNELDGFTPANDIQITVATVDVDGVILTTTITGTAVGKQWQFGTDGSLTLPDNLVIAGNTNVFGLDSALIASAPGQPLIAISTGANGAVSSIWVEDVANVGTSNIAAVYANPTVGSGIVRIAVGQNGVGSGPNIWDFGTDGTLTFPDATIQTTAYTGGGGTTLPANASGYLVNDGTGALSWAAGDGTFSGDYDDLTNKPTLFDGDYNSLTNKPELFDGAYNSLTNKPTLFDGDYNSLTNKPTYKETVSTGTGPGGNNQADSLVLAGLNPTENIPSTYGGDLILKGGYGGANNDLFGEVRIKSGTIGSNFEWHFTVDKKIKLPAGGSIVDSTGANVFVSLATLKQVVADSTDFADFKSRIAGML